MKILLPLAAVLLAASQALAQGVPTPVGPPVLTIPVSANFTVTTSSSATFTNVSANTQLALFVNIKASPTGTTPTLTYTVAEVDPGDGATTFTGAQTASTTALNAIGAPAPITISTTHSTTVKVSWVITGTTPSFTQVYVTLTAWGGALNMVQGAGVAGTPAGGLVTTTPPLTGQIPTVISGSLTPLDTPGSLVTINAACSTGVSCAAGSTALVQTAGQGGANAVFSSGSSPTMTFAADCAMDGGTAWSLTGSPSTSGLVDFITPGGLRSNTVVAPGNVSYQLVPQAGCVGTTFRVRAVNTGGTVNAQVRSTAISQPPWVGGVGATKYPSQAAAIIAQDAATPADSRALRADSTGILDHSVPWDGTNNATFKAASTPAAAGDNSLVVQQSPLANPVCTGFFNVDQTANATIITGVSGKKVYICAVKLYTETAQSVNLYEGTGTACATGVQGIDGTSSTTPSTLYAANQGLTMVSSTPWLVTKTALDNVCVRQSGAGHVSGIVTYVIQ